MQHQHRLSASLHLLASPTTLVSTPPVYVHHQGKPLCMHAAHSEAGVGEGGLGQVSTDTNLDTNTLLPSPALTQPVTTEVGRQLFSQGIFSLLISLFFLSFPGQLFPRGRNRQRCPPILQPPYHPLFDIGHRSVGLPERHGRARQILGNGFAYTLPPAFSTPDHHQRLRVAYIRYK